MSGSVGADTIESAAHRQGAHCSSEARACAGSCSLDRAHLARSYVPLKGLDHERAGCARSNDHDRARLRLGPTEAGPAATQAGQGRDGFLARKAGQQWAAPSPAGRPAFSGLRAGCVRSSEGSAYEWRAPSARYYSAASFCALGLRCWTFGITSFDSSSSECFQASGLST